MCECVRVNGKNTGLQSISVQQKKPKSPILHQIGADPQRGRDRSVRVGGISQLSACWGLLLFIHQTDIRNFQFPARRTLKPSSCPTEAPFSNRGWLLRLRKKMTNNWNCTLGSSNQNCRCWWVACVYCFHFWPILSRRRSAVFHRQHPCWPRMFEGRLLTRGTRLTDSAGTSCMCLVKKKKKDDMIWNIRLKKNPHFSLVAYSLSSVCVSLAVWVCVCPHCL